MQRPKADHEKYKLNNGEFDENKWARDNRKYIDKVEAENKSLKESLQAIAGSTQDSKEPLTKCIHGIAVKHLKK